MFGLTQLENRERIRGNPAWLFGSGEVKRSGGGKPHSHEQDWITVETSPFFIEPDFGEKLVLTPAYRNALGEDV